MNRFMRLLFLLGRGNYIYYKANFISNFLHKNHSLHHCKLWFISRTGLEQSVQYNYRLCKVNRNSTPIWFISRTGLEQSVQYNCRLCKVNRNSTPIWFISRTGLEQSVQYNYRLCKVNRNSTPNE